MDKRSSFTHIKDSTSEDFDVVVRDAIDYSSLYKNEFDNSPIDHDDFGQRTIYLAVRDVHDEDYMVCTLTHIGDSLNCHIHADTAIALLNALIFEGNLNVLHAKAPSTSWSWIATGATSSLPSTTNALLSSPCRTTHQRSAPTARSYCWKPLSPCCAT